MMAAQADIKLWFDHVYEKKGYSYLRPGEAYNIFVTLLEPTRDSKHLDVACGLGLMLRAINPHCAEIHGIDISSEAVSQSKRYCPEAQVVEGNAENMPFGNETFDSISCIGSIERIINRPRALKEQLRVAKPDARFCYMVRNSEHFIWKYFFKPFRLKNKKGHQDALNLEQWKNLFTSNGFKILNVYPDHWPYFRTLKILMPWSKINSGRIIKFPFKLNLAYEFIFVLAKA